MSNGLRRVMAVLEALGGTVEVDEVLEEASKRYEEEFGHVVLPSQLTGCGGRTKVVFVALDALAVLADELGPGLATLDEVALSDKAKIRTVVEMVVLWGIAVHLLPGVGMPPQARSSALASLANAPSFSRSSLAVVTYSPSELFVVLERLVGLGGFGSDAMPELTVENTNEILISLLAQHAVDLVAGYLQLAHAPAAASAALAASATATASFTSPGAIGAAAVAAAAAATPDTALSVQDAARAEARAHWLLASVQPDVALEVGMILLGSRMRRSPRWLVPIARRVLSDALLARGGVHALLCQMLDRGDESDYDAATVGRAVRHLSRVPSTVPRATYLARVGVQLLGILASAVASARDGKIESPAVTRAAVLTVHMLLAAHPVAMKEHFLRPLFAPFFPLFAAPDEAESLLAVPCEAEAYGSEPPEAGDGLQVDDAVREVVPAWRVAHLVGILHLVTASATPLPARAAEALAFGVPLVFALLVTATATKSFMRARIVSTLAGLARCNEATVSDAFLQLITAPNVPGLSAQVGRTVSWFAPADGGALEVRALSLDTPGLSFERFAELVPARSIEGEAQVLLDLLKVLPRDCGLPSALFFGLLDAFAGVRAEQTTEAGARDAAIAAQLEAELEAKLEAASQSRVRVRAEEAPAPSVGQMEAAARAELLREQRMRVLHMLAVLADELPIAALIGSDVDKMLRLALALLKSEAEETLGLVLQLVEYVVTGRVAMTSQAEAVTLEALAPELERLSKASGVVAAIRESATRLRVLIVSRDPAWARTATAGSSEGEVDEQGVGGRGRVSARLRDALKALSDPLLPVRAAGLVQLRKIVQGGLSAGHLGEVKRIFESQLSDDDSFVFMAAVEGLAAVVDAAPSLFLDDLIRAYGSASQSEQHRLKLGEALLRVALMAGDLLPEHAPRMVRAFLAQAGDENEQVRASALSNLATLAGASPVPAAVRRCLEELVVGVSALLLRDESTSVRRAAAFVSVLLIEGLGLEATQVGSVMRDVRHALTVAARDDADEVVRGHAERGLERLRSVVREAVVGSRSSGRQHFLEIL
ncbi:uncharacterized protein AMSG_11322 [Thecamonas trahens ATCC 50062]|uniref:Uncharacterized protein n=1 Tax=Thecamonas trahens ATCC 50062 TaxID=461836 RepID=A0A0L0DUJ8_THETB|nr:hypothetical protein AMSG_11322 [Thecamonas trahens ATCC 50062]KNC55872.1 hypothetical protein AMSG_11322 [Thecamonas trahens ATCC 50062]|eukprot:XP_013752794.1 hypothetical protein AMSG_11322 [Thecamonas trahens ATCC 50062]